MKNRNIKFITQASVLALAVLSLTACNTFTRLAEVGKGPVVSEIANPVKRPKYRPVSMPMPGPKKSIQQRQFTMASWRARLFP